MIKVVIKSLFNRKATTFLTILSIALSVSLLLGIERVRSGARKSFESTVSGVDLIAGARSGPVNLLLYSVFRIGDATNNVSYQSYERFSVHEKVAWTIPISLGDSHRGFRVVGTNGNYFKFYRFAGDKKLSFSQGKAFEGLFDVVIGSQIAKSLGYSLGEKITLSHGSGEVSFQEHADKPFSIVGILDSTGTPVDKSVHISLEAMHALHVDWKDGAPPRPGEEVSQSHLLNMDIKPAAITAFFIKLKSKIAIFNVQREINDFREEALLAILPGVTLRNLWETIGLAENALFAVSIMVFFVTLIGMVISLLATMNERRREMAILRSVGAKKSFIFSVLIVESCVLTLSGMVAGLLVLYFGLTVSRPVLESEMGMTLGLFAPTFNDVIYLCAILVGSVIVSVVPAWRAYRNSLADGLMVKS
tara:strand:+ start:39713 stop:40969 length:1257 start_codon:yes stop_codon:yes gene_type:complete